MTIYRQIAARVKGFMQSDDHFLLLKLPTGYGKTITTTLTIDEWNFNWIYLAPFHEVIHKNLEQTIIKKGGFDYTHLKSRAKLCGIPEWRNLITEYGINIKPICDNTCPRKEEGCEYYERQRHIFQEQGNIAGVHHHIPEFLSNFLYSDDGDDGRIWHHYDVIIIDENPIGVLFLNERTDNRKLEEVLYTIQTLGVPHPDHNKVVDFLQYLINKFSKDQELNYRELYRRISDIDFKEYYEFYQIEIVNSLVDDTLDYEDVPQDFLNWMVKISDRMTRLNIRRMIVKKGESGYTRKHYYLMVFMEDALHDLPIKIIGLDGTADITIWSRLINEQPKIFEKTRKYKNIYQLTSGEYPLSSWLKPNSYQIRETGIRLCKLIDLIADKKRNKVLVICNKSLEPHIRRYTESDNLIYGSYYYLRSRNDFYITADTVILASQPNIPQFQLGCFAALSSWDEEFWRHVFTDEEMIQGVGRIRADKNIVNGRVREKREIYIFPAPRSIPGKGEVNDIFPESEKVSYRRLRDRIEFKPLPEQMFDLIPSNGIYKSKLKEEFSYNDITFQKIFRILEARGWIHPYEPRKKVRRKIKKVA